MITLIGHYNSVIGFGLCGIKDVHEATRRTSEAKIISWIEESKNDLIMIDQDLFEKIKYHKTNKILIKIPDREAEEDSEDIDALVKDAIGVSIQV